MTYHPPYVFGIGRWKSQGAHVFNISFCIFDEYLHRMTLILTKTQKQHHKHTVKSSKIGSVWVPCMLARSPYEYTHAEPHDNQVLAMLVL